MLDIEETARFDNGTASSSVIVTEDSAQGAAGNIRINARNLELLSDSVLVSITVDIGDAGNVILDIEETARFDDSAVSSGALLGGEGNGGDVQLRAINAYLNNSAFFSSGFGQGDAGNLNLTIQNQLELINSTLDTQALSNAGGQINIEADTIFLIGDSDIQTFVDSGENNGGDITIIGNALIALDESDILAFAVDGNGGDIDLRQITFFGENIEFDAIRPNLRILNDNNQVDVNATGGITSGDISINDGSFLENSLNELPDDLLVPDTLVATSCIARSNDSSSSFVNTGREGLLQQPGAPQPAYNLATVQSGLDASSTHEQPSVAEPDDIYRLADGRLVLSHTCESTSSTR